MARRVMTCIDCKGKSRDSRSEYGHLVLTEHGTTLVPHTKKETK